MPDSSKYQILLHNVFMKSFYQFHDKEYDTLAEAKEEVKRIITETFRDPRSIQIIQTVYQPKLSIDLQ